jgi:hypothetical protein
MGSDIGTDGGTNGGADAGMDPVGRLSQISSRTSMMTIDAVLRTVPRNDKGYAAAAAELRSIARRMVHTTKDFAAARPGID